MSSSSKENKPKSYYTLQKYDDQKVIVEDCKPPSIKEQKEKVTNELLYSVLGENEVWCLVEKRWLDSWKAYVVFDEPDVTETDADHPGPINNEILLENEEEFLKCVKNEQPIPYAKLKAGIEEGDQYELIYELLPLEAWDHLLEWYGGKHMGYAPTIARYTYKRRVTSTSYNLDIRPCFFKVAIFGDDRKKRYKEREKKTEEEEEEKEGKDPKKFEFKEFRFNKFLTFRDVRFVLMDHWDIEIQSHMCRIAETRLWQGYLGSPWRRVGVERQFLYEYGKGCLSCSTGQQFIMECRILSEKFALDFSQDLWGDGMDDVDEEKQFEMEKKHPEERIQSLLKSKRHEKEGIEKTTEPCLIVEDEKNYERRKVIEDKNSVLEIIGKQAKESARFFQNASESLRSNRELVLSLVKSNGFILKYVSPDLKGDKEVVTLAVEAPSWGEKNCPLKYASKELKNDEQIVIRAVKSNPASLLHAGLLVRNDKRSITKMMRLQKGVLRFAPEFFMSDRDVLLEAVKNRYGRSEEYSELSLASDQLLKNDEELVISAIEHNTCAIKYASDEMKKNKRVVLMVLQRSDGMKYFQYIHEDLRNDLDFVFEVCKMYFLSCHSFSHNGAPIRRKFRSFLDECVPKAFFSDPAFIFRLISLEVESFSTLASEDLKGDKSFILDCVRSFPSVLKHVKIEYLREKSFLVDCARRNMKCIRYVTDEKAVEVSTGILEEINKERELFEEEKKEKERRFLNEVNKLVRIDEVECMRQNDLERKRFREWFERLGKEVEETEEQKKRKEEIFLSELFREKRYLFEYLRLEYTPTPSFAMKISTSQKICYFPSSLLRNVFQFLDIFELSTSTSLVSTIFYMFSSLAISVFFQEFSDGRYDKYEKFTKYSFTPEYRSFPSCPSPQIWEKCFCHVSEEETTLCALSTIVNLFSRDVAGQNFILNLNTVENEEISQISSPWNIIKNESLKSLFEVSSLGNNHHQELLCVVFLYACMTGNDEMMGYVLGRPEAKGMGEKFFFRRAFSYYNLSKSERGIMLIDFMKLVNDSGVFDISSDVLFFSPLFLHDGEGGISNFINLLTAYSVDLTQNDHYLLRFSVNHNELGLLKFLVENDFDPSACENYSICVASQSGLVEIVDFLLSDDRVDPSSKNNLPILHATQNGHTEIVKMLMNIPSVEEKLTDNLVKESLKRAHLSTSLYLLKTGRFDILRSISVEDLFRSMYELKKLDAENEEMPMMQYGDGIKILEILLNEKNVSSDTLRVCLFKSCIFGLLDVAILLLKNVDVLSAVSSEDSKNSLLKVTCERGSIGIVKLLLDAKLIDNPNKNLKEDTLTIALERKHMSLALFLLQEYKIEPDTLACRAFNEAVILCSADRLEKEKFASGIQIVRVLFNEDCFHSLSKIFSSFWENSFYYLESFEICSLFFKFAIELKERNEEEKLGKYLSIVIGDFRKPFLQACKLGHMNLIIEITKMLSAVPSFVNQIDLASTFLQACKLGHMNVVIEITKMLSAVPVFVNQIDLTSAKLMSTFLSACRDLNVGVANLLGRKYGSIFDLTSSNEFVRTFSDLVRKRTTKGGNWGKLDRRRFQVINIMLKIIYSNKNKEVCRKVFLVCMGHVNRKEYPVRTSVLFSTVELMIGREKSESFLGLFEDKDFMGLVLEKLQKKYNWDEKCGHQNCVLWLGRTDHCICDVKLPDRWLYNNSNVKNVLVLLKYGNMEDLLQTNIIKFEREQEEDFYTYSRRELLRLRNIEQKKRSQQLTPSVNLKLRLRLLELVQSKLESLFSSFPTFEERVVTVSKIMEEEVSKIMETIGNSAKQIVEWDDIMKNIGVQERDEGGLFQEMVVRLHQLLEKMKEDCDSQLLKERFQHLWISTVKIEKEVDEYFSSDEFAPLDRLRQKLKHRLRIMTEKLKIVENRSLNVFSRKLSIIQSVGVDDCNLSLFVQLVVKKKSERILKLYESMMESLSQNHFLTTSEEFQKKVESVVEIRVRCLQVKQELKDRFESADEFNVQNIAIDCIKQTYSEFCKKTNKIYNMNEELLKLCETGKEVSENLKHLGDCYEDFSSIFGLFSSNVDELLDIRQELLRESNQSNSFDIGDISRMRDSLDKLKGKSEWMKKIKDSVAGCEEKYVRLYSDAKNWSEVFKLRFKKIKTTKLVLESFLKNMEYEVGIRNCMMSVLHIDGKIHKIKQEIASLGSSENRPISSLFGSMYGMSSIGGMNSFLGGGGQQQNVATVSSSDDDDEKKRLEIDMDRLVEEKREEERKLYSFKREWEKLQRVIYMEGHRTTTSLRNILLKNQDDAFIMFLKKHGVLVGRTELDYEQPWKEVQRGQNVYLAKLKSDFFAEPKIVKVLDSNPSSRLEVQKEINALLKLRNHPSIISVNCVFLYAEQKTGSQKIGIEMDYYRTDLMKWLKGHTFLSIDDSLSPEEIRCMKTVRDVKSIVQVFRSLLEGIAFIHSNGIQHCDLKPDNVLLNDQFDVKIIDFGISREETQLTLTQKNMAATMRYLSPEGKKHFLENSMRKKARLKSRDYIARDMYACGLMMLESLIPSELCEDMLTFLEDFPLNDDSLWKGKFRLRNAEEVAVLKKLLGKDPRKRIGADELLKCDLFSERRGISSLVLEDGCDPKKSIRRDITELVRRKLDVLYEKTQQNVASTKRIRVTVDRSMYVDEEGERKRKDIVLHSLRQLVKDAGDFCDLCCPISTIFVGEKATDAGGVTRQLFSTLSEQITNGGIYCTKIGDSSNGCFYLPSNDNDHSDIFYLLGRLCFRFLLEKRNFKVSFGPLFYSYVLGQDPESDLDLVRFCKFYDPSFIPTIEKSLNDPALLQQLIGYEETYEDRDGLEIVLNESNKRQYLINNVRMKMIGSTTGNRISMNIRKGFKKGFLSLMPEDLSLEIRTLLNPFELDFLIYGDRSLSAEVLLKNVQYYSQGSENIASYIQKYFSGEESGDQNRRMSFVRFCTGSCDIVNEVLLKDGKPHKIALRVSSKDDFIMAHTCGYTLEIGRNFWDGGDELYARFSKAMDFRLNEFEDQGMEE